MQWLSMTSAIMSCLCVCMCVLLSSASGLMFVVCFPMSPDMSLPACFVSMCVKGETQWTNGRKDTLQTSTQSLHVSPSTVTHLFCSQSPLSPSSLCLNACITTAAVESKPETGSAAAWECCREGDREGGWCFQPQQEPPKTASPRQKLYPPAS